MSAEDLARIEAAALEAIAYSAGVDHDVVRASRRIAELGMDSVAIAALKLVLEAELDMQIDDETLHARVMSANLSEASAALYHCWTDPRRRSM
jgi:acyl carrier protein